MRWNAASYAKPQPSKRATYAPRESVTLLTCENLGGEAVDGGLVGRSHAGERLEEEDESDLRTYLKAPGPFEGGKNKNTAL